MRETGSAQNAQQPEAHVNPSDEHPHRSEGPETETEVERLTAQLDAAHRRIDELARGLQHSEAEREAFKQRLTRERDQLIDLEKGKVALVLLEAIDELELCLGSPDGSPLWQGVKLIRDSLVKRAEEFGLERVELLGRPYDPNLSEASDMELTTEPGQDGRVVGVIKAAWALKGRVLRPGRVRVAKYVAPAQA